MANQTNTVPDKFMKKAFTQWMHIKCIFSQGVCIHVDHLFQFAQQLRNTSQSLCGSSKVSVLKDQLHQLRVSSAHCLLQNCTHSSTQPSLPCTAPMRFTEDAYLGRQGKVLKGQSKLDTNGTSDSRPVWFSLFYLRNIHRDIFQNPMATLFNIMKEKGDWGCQSPEMKTTST